MPPLDENPHELCVDSYKHQYAHSVEHDHHVSTYLMHTDHLDIRAMGPSCHVYRLLKNPPVIASTQYARVSQHEHPIHEYYLTLTLHSAPPYQFLAHVLFETISLTTKPFLPPPLHTTTQNLEKIEQYQRVNPLLTSLSFLYNTRTLSISKLIFTVT